MLSASTVLEGSNALLQLLAVLASPEKAKNQLEALVAEVEVSRKNEETAARLLSEADKKMAEARLTEESALRAQAKAEELSANVQTAQETFKAQIQRRVDELTLREEELRTKDRVLGEQQTWVEGEKKELERLQADLKVREERAAKALVAAEAVKADYEGKIEKLKRIAVA